MKSVKFLIDLQKMTGMNDNQIAKALRISHSAISQYKSGKRVMDEEACLKIAHALDMDNPLPILMAAGIDRAEKQGQKSLWEVFSQRMATTAASAILGNAMLLGGLAPSKIAMKTSLSATP